ncbi:MAG: FAD-dependent oxidoreductase [Verrucomicrobia bacterium]|nr:FAD-dependent oxidoreductase [Verrucomicrobiota bacterium]MCF7709344.1 FAD-dependent oxidoreductase [Verrucomicrobiota bacterium]
MRVTSQHLRKSSVITLFLTALLFTAVGATEHQKIPVIFDGDVLVIGGSTAAVAAATEAANAGADVFLTTRLHYLGEDMCGTYRLWLNEGEKPDTPLAKKVFRKRTAPGLDFKYEADLESSPRHPDTTPPSVLADGHIRDAVNHSVQYDGDATITIDLGKPKEIKNVKVFAFQRPSDFEVASINVIPEAQESDGIHIPNSHLNDGGFEDTPIEIAAEVNATLRHLKLEIRKSARASRILLSEIVVEPAESTEKASFPPYSPVTPMHVKRVLDQTLIDNGVKYLYGSYPVDIIRNAQGDPKGIVIENRSGRQALKADVIIDATPRALAARMFDIPFTPYKKGVHTFKWTLVGGPPKKGTGIKQVPHPNQVRITTSKGKTFIANEYILEIPMTNGEWPAFAEAEQVARDMTWTKAQAASSDTLFQVPPDHVINKHRFNKQWPGHERMPIDAFRTDEYKNILILNGCANISRQSAATMLRPCEFMGAGKKVGQAAAALADTLSSKESNPKPRKTISASKHTDISLLPAKEVPRFADESLISYTPKQTPVAGEYDVVVVGGGTGGAPAGISAARHGAKTLVIEYLHGLGGVGTMGMISSYYHGNRIGFTREIDEAIAALGDPNVLSGGAWNVEWKKEWYRKELREAGADIWFGALGTGAIREGDKVRGIVAATPGGPVIVKAKVVIDSTGSATIAAAAGAECADVNETHVAVQGSGLPWVEPGARYINTDFTFVDESDIYDIWRTLVIAKFKYKGAYDVGQLIDTRERRRIVGDYILSPLDIINQRTFADTIVVAKSDFDSHGFIIHPYFMIKFPTRTEMTARVPFRCLLPKGLDGLLVTGLGVSAQRDAIPVIRMQADIQNQGYAAGLAASMAVNADRGLREINIAKLQEQLNKVGILNNNILNETNSPTPTPEEIKTAVNSVANDYNGLSIVMQNWDAACPLVVKAYKNSTNKEAALVYAHVLGIMGQPAGAQTLADEISGRQWDKGWNYTGMGQYGASMSSLDSYLIALGRTKADFAATPIIEKLEQLDAGSAFSHFRATAIALETLGDEAAAPVLAALLNKPGVADHAITDIKEYIAVTGTNSQDTSLRNNALKELMLARALYRCGDFEGLGKRILEEYVDDLRGHFSKHAFLVLNNGTKN